MIVSRHVRVGVRDRLPLISALNETRILLQTPAKFNEHTADELGSFLTSYFESCAQAVETPAALPHFRVRQDPDVVQRFIRFYTEIVEESKLSKAMDMARSNGWNGRCSRKYG